MLRLRRIMLLMPLVLGACKSTTSATTDPTTDENARIEAFFEQAFEEALAMHPQFQTRLGIKTNYDKWEDLSPVFGQREHALNQRLLQELAAFDREQLSEANRLNARLLKQQLERDIEGYRWRDYDYPVNQMYGWQSQIPAFLINLHRVESKSDAEAYVKRLQNVQPLLAQVEANLERMEKKGISAPAFVYPMVLEDARNVIAGRPFDPNAAAVSPLLEDFERKVQSLEIPSDEKEALLANAVDAMQRAVKPAYVSLIASVERQSKDATTDDGAWKFPKGDEFYRFRLKSITTTDMTADEIHRLGLSEVARIHDEMRGIMKKVGFEGDLSAFFQHMRTADRFIYSNDDAGRAEYLTKVDGLLEAMRAKLPDLFGRLPKAPMEVKRVEPFRAKSAGKAFYNPPAPDGSRPGIYYVNLYDMTAMPSYQMEALAYHEGLPGHHMQIAIAQELEGLPKFRRFGGYTAYVEGWGLYAEYVPKEMGMYEDPYSDFGRLAMELWRACRLVVDTGIHARKWSREKAIDYLMTHTPNPKGDVVKAIERYIVMPGQATAYKVGMLEILELRRKAKDALGDDFDLRAFHDVVLGGGPLPLSMLEEQVDAWIADSAT